MRHTVLIVDDSEFVRQTIAAALGVQTSYPSPADEHRTDNINSFDVVVAKNGREALDILRQDRGVGAVILDLRMPILDGRAVLRQWPRPADAPVFVVVTGDRDERAALDECLALGADHVMTKPVDIENLRHLLRGALGHEEASSL